MNDQQLLTKLKQGDSKAVQYWFSSYHDRLYELVSYKVSIHKDREEIVQDTFMSCLKHLPLFRGESSIWTWMVRIARHEIADYYRKRYAKKAIHALSLDDFFSIGQILDAHATSEKVRLALSKIRADYRELLLLKYVDKKKVKEIAEELGRTVKSVEADLFRARSEFRLAYRALG